MYALEKITGNVDVEKLLEHYGFDTSNIEGNMIRSHCAIHGGNNPTAFAFNNDNGLWFCHTNPECGGGDIFTLVEKMEGISFVEATKWIANFFNIDINGLELIERKSKNQKEIANFMKVMSKRKDTKEIEEYIISADVKELKCYRDYKKDTIDKFGLRYVKAIELVKRNGDPYKLYKRLLFPIYMKNTLIGVSLRATSNNDAPRWSHQPVKLKTGDLLYNYDSVSPGGNVTVVEGIGDVWAYHEIGVTAVCTFGAHLTDNQYRMLLMTGCNITLSYDGDDAGRKATSKAITMLKDKANICVVKFNEGEDPANISREELEVRYGSRRKV